MLQNYLLGSPNIDDLLTLIPFNTYRALITNAQLLGYRMHDINHDNAISHFYGTSTSAKDWQQYPPSLRPTTIQRQISHHPWLDLFPLPRMRDNLIRAGTSLDEDELCEQLVGFASGGSSSVGFIIWGEAWDSLSWEASEDFMRRWRLMLEGCNELFMSSRKWREQRGESCLT